MFSIVIIAVSMSLSHTITIFSSDVGAISAVVGQLCGTSWEFANLCYIAVRQKYLCIRIPSACKPGQAIYQWERLIFYRVSFEAPFVAQFDKAAFQT